MIYKAEGGTCHVQWPNGVSGTHSASELRVVGRVPEINIGDIVERGNICHAKYVITYSMALPFLCKYSYQLCL